MGGQVEFLENFGKEHDEIDYCGNDNNEPQLVKDLFLNFKGSGRMNNYQHHGYQSRPGRKSRR